MKRPIIFFTSLFLGGTLLINAEKDSLKVIAYLKAPGMFSDIVTQKIVPIDSRSAVFEQKTALKKDLEKNSSSRVFITVKKVELKKENKKTKKVIGYFCGFPIVTTQGK